MKKKISLLASVFFTSSVSLFAHDGHVHSGTFWENAAHFALTNGYIVVPVAVAGYFLIKRIRVTSKTKSK
ncbi:MAG: hypothetical protein OQJ81_03890 [Melioribacteraceae bacterium]|nr:hypothetical protein [Melioribacteraceae bacterium]